jgi:hypothetical protein
VDAVALGKIERLNEVAKRYIGHQIALAKTHTSDADVRHRLLLEFSRSYLQGAITSLAERIKPDATLQGHLLMYLSLIGDMSMVMDIYRNTRIDNSVARLGAQEINKALDPAITGFVPMRLAGFLRYGNPDTAWQEPTPAISKR